MCYCVTFAMKESPDYYYEYVYPFGNFNVEFMDNFSIFVRSPSQCYYNELFGSFVLSPAEAWRLYCLLLDFQQCPDCQKSSETILGSIPDHKESLEDQFKFYYEKALYNVLKYVAKT